MTRWWDAAAFRPQVAWAAPWEYRHGPHCDCLGLLSWGAGSRHTLRFSFCRGVLQKHWQMSCQHGCASPAATTPGSDGRWRGIGRIDATMAVLIRNG